MAFFMLLDEQLHLAPAAVDCLVEKPPVPALQVHHHKPHGRAQPIMLPAINAYRRVLVLDPDHAKSGLEIERLNRLLGDDGWD